MSDVSEEREMAIVLLNLLYALVGGGAAIAFMFVGYKVIDHLTPFSTPRSSWRPATAQSAPWSAACSSASASPLGWS